MLKLSMLPSLLPTPGVGSRGVGAEEAEVSFRAGWWALGLSLISGSGICHGEAGLARSLSTLL